MNLRSDYKDGENRCQMIRAFLLEEKDEFKYFGKAYRVFEITDTEIRCTYQSKRNNVIHLTLGRNSQERVELIIEL